MHDLPLHAASVLLGPDAADGDPTNLVARVCEALRELDNIPIDRASWSMLTLHPQIRSVQIRWAPHEGASVTPRRYERDGVLLARSPLRLLYNGETTTFRRRLAPGEDLGPFDILSELRDDGFTDYVAMVAPRIDRLERAPITLATRAPAGFSDSDLASLEALLPLASLAFGIHAHRQRTRTLLETYLGRDPATRVLDGHIQRGDVVAVDAAVCFCDLRGFTERSNRLAPEALLSLLHDTFEAVVGAFDTQGGDVLKFIGDAVLAVFVGPLDPHADTVERAYAAVTEAQIALEAVADRRREAGLETADVGFALHVGPVTYGNIGGATRLDFTVLGPTVNLASRLEGLCGALGESLVLSADAARCLRAANLRAAGAHTLKGIPSPVEVFVRRAEEPRAS